MAPYLPAKIGSVQAESDKGRLEHVKGIGSSKDCRWRACRFVKSGDGARVEILRRKGNRDEVRKWFDGWISESSAITQSEAAALDAASKSKKEEKLEEKSYESLVKEIRELKDNVALIALAIDQSFGPIAASLLELSKNGIALNAPVEQHPVMEAEVEKPKEPREADYDDIAKFADGVDVLDMVNTRTKMTYAKFVDWCRECDIVPCTPNKMSLNVAKAKGLVCKDGYFRKAGA